MTAALIDTLARVESTSTGTRSSRSAKATTSFDEAISDAVDDAASDRERPATTKKHDQHADREHRAAEAGLVPHLSPPIEQRAHGIDHRAEGSRLVAVADGTATRQRRSGHDPVSWRAGHEHASVTSNIRYDAMRLDAAPKTDGKEAAAGIGRTNTAVTRARASETLHQTDAAQTSAENRSEATSGDHGKATGAQRDVSTPHMRSSAHPPAADMKISASAKSAIPPDTTQASARTSASTAAFTPAPTATPTPLRAATHTPLAEAPATKTAGHHAAPTPTHSALQESPSARESSYLKTAAGPKPTQQAGKQPTAANAPVIPVHLPAASATTVNSTPVVAPAAPTVPLPLAQPDVAAILASLRGGPDGTYLLRAQVHPAELGSVNITATVAGGSLTVLLTGDTQAHHALSQALPQLRAHLADQGFTGVDVGLGSPDQQAGQTGGQSGEHHTQGSDRPLGAEIGPDGPADHRAPTPLRHAAGAIDTML